MIDPFVAAGIAIAGLMLTTWVISVLTSNASIVDIIWGLGFVLVAGVAMLTVDAPSERAWLLTALVTIWGLRLTGYLAWRNIGKPEDFRYRQMRQRWGERFPLVSLATVFGLQGAIMWIVSLPVTVGVQSRSELGALDWLGVALWAVGVFFETVGDLQLARFKTDPANQGKVMDRGLWRYTRHPNYFGDFCVWWGIYLVALGGGAWWTVIGPIVMSILLRKYSGVGLLEKTIAHRRPGYAEYVRRTNAFFPGPPRQ